MLASQDDQNSARLKRFADLGGTNMLLDLADPSGTNMTRKSATEYAEKAQQYLLADNWVVVWPLLEGHNSLALVEWFLNKLSNLLFL